MLMKRGRHSKFASNQKSPLIHPSPWVSFTNAGTPLLRHAPPQQNYPRPPSLPARKQIVQHMHH